MERPCVPEATTLRTVTFVAGGEMLITSSPLWISRPSIKTLDPERSIPSRFRINIRIIFFPSLLRTRPGAVDIALLPWFYRGIITRLSSDRYRSDNVVATFMTSGTTIFL